MSSEDNEKNQYSSYLNDKIEDLEKCLLQSKEKFRSVADFAPVGLFLDDANGKAIYINRKCAEFIGVPPENALNFDWAKYLHPEDRDLMVSTWEKAFKNSSEFRLEYRWVHSDGKIVWTLGEVIPIKNESGEVILFIGSLTDITSRKEAELEKEHLQKQLLHMQKMESIGRMAAGLAHNFNNLLHVILGNTALAMLETESNDEAQVLLKEVIKAGNSASDITKQLFSFASKQTINPKVFDINDSLKGIHSMISSLIGSRIDISWNPSKAKNQIYMDPSQFEQLVLNLCINAGDAIADTGTITIETSANTFDEAFCKSDSNYLPGTFVLLSISDNGCGMDEETLENMFDPFFTTKDEHKGTGLGLASVYGIVKQNNGFIVVDSKSGEGTTFDIYFPRYIEK